MNISATVSSKQIMDLLLNIAVARPVFIWGPPGIEKSSLVQQFADQVALPCVSLLLLERVGMKLDRKVMRYGAEQAIYGIDRV